MDQQARVRQAVQAFYDAHPYPPPMEDLDGYRRRWQDVGRRRSEFHLHWPDRPYRTGLRVLVAGCGTMQAAKHALREPHNRVVGIDLSAASVRHTETLRRRYGLTNLEVHQLPVEEVGQLGQRFDQIVCTGVLHHLPDPDAGLRALQAVLEPDGALHLMVYAPYGRVGIYLLQEYCRRLGIGHSPREVRDLALALTALPRSHPLARLLAESPDFQTLDGLADALLNPQDRAYSVPQLFDWLQRCGLRFGRWLHQAPYLPQCGSLASTPHAARLAALPPMEQYAAVELWRGNMLRHSLIAYRADRPVDRCLPRFEADDWLSYVPLRLPETTNVRERLPAGATVALINSGHSDPDLVLFVNSTEWRMVQAIDGRRTIAEILEHVSLSKPAIHPTRELARSLFQRLWWYDQVVFNIRCAHGADDTGAGEAVGSARRE
ncbi:MAG: class I SAM-dependent methyltransferase [Caldilineales bacterium]|nr:class I SAM-dependent methyltransferase [Caldilineales bacterium]MDW8317141.1 class I SAM-dependent methyltransferase [Anaerolineae bacterium]